MPHNITEKYNVLTVLLRKYGLRGFVKLLWTDIFFDMRYGVDTYSPVAKEELFTAGIRRDLQNRYVPSTFGIVDIAISEAKAILGDDIAEFAGFVDYGSGKGKVLIAAAYTGFKKITGIEFSADLNIIANTNLKKLDLADVAKSLNVDATKYFPDPSDLVLYFFNPFEGEILEQTLINIKSVEATSTRVLIVFNPIADDIYSKHFTKIFEKTAQPGNARYNIYTDA